MTVINDTLPSDPIVVPADRAEVLELAPGESMRILIAGDDQAPVLIDGTLPPGGSPPVHRHPWAAYEVVIEGTIRMVINDQEYDLGPGDGCYTPANAPHSFLVTSDTPARVVGVSLPGGADFYRGMAELVGSATSEGPDHQALGRLADRHGAMVLGPPMRS